MMLAIGRTRNEEGFTLLELVAAMSVFAVAAAALLTVIVAGIRTAGVAKDRTLGKELARKQLEEMRRLPFWISQATFGDLIRRDLLDNYFPDLLDPDGVAGPQGYDSTTDTYTITQSSIPDFPRYRMEIKSAFVLAEPNQALRVFDFQNPVIRPYAWNTPGIDIPPTQALRVEVTTFWGPRTTSKLTLTSFLGPPRPGDLILDGEAGGTLITVDGAFSDLSTILGEAGIGNAALHEGNVTTARADMLAARGRITRDLDGFVNEVLGAQLAAVAPPTFGPQDAPPSSGSSISYLGVTGVLIGKSNVRNLKATVATPPEGSGKLVLFDDPDDLEGGTGLAVTNEVTSDPKTLFETSKPFIAVVKVKDLVTSLKPAVLSSSCTETDDNVSCESTGKTGELRVAPVKFGTFATTNGYLVTVRFTELFVKAKASRLGSAGSPVAEARFAGTVRYWKAVDASTWIQETLVINHDPATPNSLPDAAARSGVCVRFDVLLGICSATLADYIADWSALETGVTSLGKAEADALDGSTANASLEGVLRIQTAQTNALGNSAFLIRMGALSARATDNR